MGLLGLTIVASCSTPKLSAEQSLQREQLAEIKLPKPWLHKFGASPRLLAWWSFAAVHGFCKILSLTLSCPWGWDSTYCHNICCQNSLSPDLEAAPNICSVWLKVVTDNTCRHKKRLDFAFKKRCNLEGALDQHMRLWSLVQEQAESSCFKGWLL